MDSRTSFFWLYIVTCGSLSQGLHAPISSLTHIQRRRLRKKIACTPNTYVVMTVIASKVYYEVYVNMLRTVNSEFCDLYLCRLINFRLVGLVVALQCSLAYIKVTPCEVNINYFCKNKSDFCTETTIFTFIRYNKNYSFLQINCRFFHFNNVDKSSFQIRLVTIFVKIKKNIRGRM